MAHWLRHSRPVAGHGSWLSGKGWCGLWCLCQRVVCGTIKRHVSRCRSLAVRRVTTLPGGDCSWMWAAPGHSMGF